MYILKVYLIHYTVRQNANVKKSPFVQNKRYKNALFFLSRATTHHSFAFNLRFLYELRRKIHLSSLKLCVGFSIFDSVLLLLKFIFFSTKYMDLLTLKSRNFFQN